MNKIYFISCFFVPMGRSESNRAFMVKYLEEDGWDLEVVAGENYKSLILNFQEDQSLWEVIPKGLKIHRFNGRPGWMTYDLKRLLNIGNNIRWHWIHEAERNLQLAEKGVIFAIVPQLDDAVLAYRLACKFDCPLVLYYVDEEKDVAKEIVDRAEVLFGVTQHITKSLAAQYGHKDIRLSENGYLQEISPPEKDSQAFPLRLVYAGSMTFRTRPEIFAQAWHLLFNKEPGLAQNIEIDFYGPPNYYPSLFLKKWLNNNLRFKGFLPVSQLMQTLPGYDMALTSVHTDISFSSKTYQYLNAGLPLLVSAKHPGLKEFVDEHQIGLATSRDVKEVAQKLKQLIEGKEQILKWRRKVLGIKSRFSFRERVREISRTLKERLNNSKG